MGLLGKKKKAKFTKAEYTSGRVFIYFDNNDVEVYEQFKKGGYWRKMGDKTPVDSKVGDYLNLIEATTQKEGNPFVPKKRTKIFDRSGE